MKRAIVVVGLILLIAGGVMILGNFNTSKSPSWDSLFPGVAPILFRDQAPIYAHIDLTGFAKGETVKVTVTPTEPDDMILLLLMTPQAYQQFLATSVTKSDVLVWKEPATPGDVVSLDYTAPYAGDYVVVLRAWGDANKDGIPFQFSMEISQPLDLIVPGLGIALVGIIVLVFGLAKKSTVKAVPSYAPPPTPMGPTATKYCINCGAQVPAQAKHCSKCGAPQG